MSATPLTFGLIVTGRGEECFLPNFFNREFIPRAFCKFEVIRFFPQLRPATSPKEPHAITGTDKPTLSRDEELGLTALGYLRLGERKFLLVIDDLEGDPPEPVFRRYREALDRVIKGPGLSSRAAVHFLVNMVEAYYFAHAASVNHVAGRQILPDDHPTDVELIGHPKGKLKSLWPEFDETRHGEEIMELLDAHHVLSRPTECCWFRAIFAWCVDKLVQNNSYYALLDPSTYCLDTGCKSPTCYPQ